MAKAPPKKASPKKAPTKGKRRPRGAPRQLLLEAARDLFSRQDYRSTTTREIAEAAGVLEHLLFRQFGSKAALFREALVVPFTSFVDEFDETWRDVDYEATDEVDLAEQFVGRLYDFFVDHRGLVVTLWASNGLSEDELKEAGIADVNRALATLGRIGAEGLDLRGAQVRHPDVAARSTVAMVAGMAAFRTSSFRGARASRAVVVEEMAQLVLHGLLHRER